MFCVFGFDNLFHPRVLSCICCRVSNVDTIYLWIGKTRVKTRVKNENFDTENRKQYAARSALTHYCDVRFEPLHSHLYPRPAKPYIELVVPGQDKKYLLFVSAPCRPVPTPVRATVEGASQRVAWRVVAGRGTERSGAMPAPQKAALPSVCLNSLNQLCLPKLSRSGLL